MRCTDVTLWHAGIVGLVQLYVHSPSRDSIIFQVSYQLKNSVSHRMITQRLHSLQNVLIVKNGLWSSINQFLTSYHASILDICPSVTHHAQWHSMALECRIAKSDQRKPIQRTVSFTLRMDPACVICCQAYPGYSREPHWNPMGLPEISRVTWKPCMHVFSSSLSDH